MSQDIVSDVLNQIMNAKKSGKKEIIAAKHSKLLLDVLNIAKETGYLDYSKEKDGIKIGLKNVNAIRAIKPRYTVSVKRIDFYARRYLPARNFGFVILSTSEGLMKHYEAKEKNIGGCLIAYVY